ncbi:MAG TPA: FAD-dependent oxidoreductase [Sphingobium sp.]|uniref:3-hydroxyacyl-CoA dehydrogenase/enoyl-CoA hydratase family protein n=1 Tax=Sphingobium sp. TaxID=1912891 RepID=UPI002ED0AC45
MGTIRTAAVIGAGVMGSGIAAHLANAGLDVILLDMEKALADAGIARQLKAGGFMDPAFAGRISTGSTQQDLARLADADWIVEAVAEDVATKQMLYRSIDGVRKAGSIVSSNTSTIPLADLMADMPQEFASDFLITHFFNPPRIMRLLELVSGEATKPDVTEKIVAFAARSLGKSVVMCNDTPGFIGNRIGNYWLSTALNEAIALGIDVEEADAVIGKPFGIPATGIFGLIDLVGIDLLPMVLRSLQGATGAHDSIQDYPAEPALIAKMIAQNRLGRKSGAGFARLSPGRKAREVIDLATGDYRPSRAAASESLAAAQGDARALMEHPGLGGRYAAIVMEKTLAYAASLMPEIADTPDAVDEAMRTGYGWKHGPFELIDRLSADWLKARLDARGTAIPPYLAIAAQQGGFYAVRDGERTSLRPDGVIKPLSRSEDVRRLCDLALAAKPVASWQSANLWDLGDGVACLEIRSKMNTVSPELLDAIRKALDRCGNDFRALVIGGDAPYFSAGADLRIFVETFEKGGREAISAFIDHGQRTFQAIKYAPFPVVAAATGAALGGGCELLLHCDAIQAHAELSMGLVETSVGLIPGWGGCKEMMIRLASASAAPRGPVAAALAAYDLIASAKVSSSAFDARARGFLRPSDAITMNRDHLIADAKAKALSLADGYVAPEPLLLSLSGPSGGGAIFNVIDSDGLAGRISAHDRLIGKALANVLTGGSAADPLRPLTQEAVMLLEREAFVDLIATPASFERIRHMLKSGKPLRN